MQSELDLARITDEEFETMVAELICRRFESTKSILLMVTQEKFGDFHQKAMLISAISQTNSESDETACRSSNISDGVMDEVENEIYENNKYVVGLHTIQNHN